MKRYVLVLLTAAVPVAAVVVLAFGLTACGGGGNEGGGGTSPATPPPTQTVSPTISPSGSATPAGTMRLSLSFLRRAELGVAHRVVPATRTPGAESLKQLFAGPNAAEKAAGLTSAVPEGVKLNGLTIDQERKLATVDLSHAFAEGDGALALQARVAQVVYTLTQFPTVTSVRFLIDGKADVPLGGEGLVLSEPQTRADWQDLLPAIFVETPAVGDVIMSSPLVLRGSASVFEATFVAELRLPEGVVIKKTVTAAEGAPGRGAFLARLRVPPFVGGGKLVVYEVSMADGSHLHEVRIPLRFAVED
jgi:germination protein M